MADNKNSMLGTKYYDIIPWERIVNRKAIYTGLSTFLKEFISTDKIAVEVDFARNGYQSYNSFRNAVYRSSRKQGYPISVYQTANKTALLINNKPQK